ncbi:hypothetical protein V5799_033650 [Amblyomma americanum]|uniref:Uncharacterized protein n=1 Tax=Amblyomma americanum TaxID=6943 RepID=A0AAQ4DMQ1_AMBAM
MAEPTRNVRRSLMAGLLVTTVVYVLTNSAYATVLDFGALASTQAIAWAFALNVWGDVAYVAIPVAVSISVFGALCASFFSSPASSYLQPGQGTCLVCYFSSPSSPVSR